MFYGIYADPAEATVEVTLTFGPGHDFAQVIDPEQYDDDGITLEDRLFPVGLWSAPFGNSEFVAAYVDAFAQSDLGRTMIADLGKIEMVRITVRTPLALTDFRNARS